MSSVYIWIVRWPVTPLSGHTAD